MEEKTESKKKGTNEKKEESVKGKVTVEEKAQKQMKNESNSNKKRVSIILIAVAVVVVLVIAVIGIFAGRILNKMKLNQEINALFSEELTEETMNIKTTGKYAIIETAIKDYYKKVTETRDRLMENIQDEKIQNMLSIENYKEDGPEFNSSKEYINSMKTEFNQLADEIVGLMNTEVIMAQIEDKNLNEYYTNIYKSYFFDEENLTEALDEVSKEIDGTKTIMNNLYDTEIKILDFLSENKAHWRISGSTISFDNSALLAQYNTLKMQLSV